MALLGAGYGTYGPAVISAANTYGVPSNIYVSLVQQESSFNPNADAGYHGGYGLSQLLQSTANNLGVDRYDVSQNILGGAKLLRENYDRTGNWTDALSLYRIGKTADKSSIGADYANQILGRAGKLAGGALDKITGGAASSLIGKAKSLLSGGVETALHLNPATAPFAFGADLLGISPFGGGKSWIQTFIDWVMSWVKPFFQSVAIVLIGLILLFVAFYLLGRQTPEFKAAAKAFS